jgi:hypothetical protein
MKGGRSSARLIGREAFGRRDATRQASLTAGQTKISVTKRRGALRPFYLFVIRVLSLKG